MTNYKELLEEHREQKKEVHVGYYNGLSRAECPECIALNDFVAFLESKVGEKQEQYLCQSYYNENNILKNCSCGKCEIDIRKTEPSQEIEKDLDRSERDLKDSFVKFDYALKDFLETVNKLIERK